jgi:hypothetical protein
VYVFPCHTASGNEENSWKDKEVKGLLITVFLEYDTENSSKGEVHLNGIT